MVFHILALSKEESIFLTKVNLNLIKNLDLRDSSQKEQHNVTQRLVNISK